MDYSALTKSNILYYPSINFRDHNFVKSCLCIWDTIYRIVPDTYIPDDSEEIEIAIQAGTIKNIQLNKRDLNIAADSFLDFITGTQFLPAGLEGNTINLHKDKVDSRLYPYLKELSKKTTGDWLTLSEEIVHGYMFFLANSICENRQMPKITDDADVFSIMTYFENNGDFDEWVQNCQAQEYYSSLILPTFIPSEIDKINMDTILKFREKTQEGRLEFRNSISEFADELKNIQDKEYALDIVLRLKDQLENSKQNIIESGINIIKSTFIPSYLSVGIPIQFTTLGLLGMQGDPFSMFKIAGTFLIGAVAAFADGYSKSKSWKSNTASYYFQLKSKFGDLCKTPRYDRIFEEFIND
jgi:uncharacterized protein YozE (UPF0346 family)